MADMLFIIIFIKFVFMLKTLFVLCILAILYSTISSTSFLTLKAPIFTPYIPLFLSLAKSVTVHSGNDVEYGEHSSIAGGIA